IPDQQVFAIDPAPGDSHQDVVRARLWDGKLGKLEYLRATETRHLNGLHQATHGLGSLLYMREVVTGPAPIY
ncbi:MAG: hypothetical protein EBT33_06380, partial [Betaproteobacteria bacterium]|nr:hypothetical protein [Betaproteobacteria bacterium]